MPAAAALHAVMCPACYAHHDVIVQLDRRKAADGKAPFERLHVLELDKGGIFPPVSEFLGHALDSNEPDVCQKLFAKVDKASASAPAAAAPVLARPHKCASNRGTVYIELSCAIHLAICSASDCKRAVCQNTD